MVLYSFCCGDLNWNTNKYIFKMKGRNNKTTSRESFNYLGALGHGAWQARWSSVKAEALCACNRR